MSANDLEIGRSSLSPIVAFYFWEMSAEYPNRRGGVQRGWTEHKNIPRSVVPWKFALFAQWTTTAAGWLMLVREEWRSINFKEMLSIVFVAAEQRFRTGGRVYQNIPLNGSIYLSTEPR